VDDVVAVYKELLKTCEPTHIGVYGTSEGSFLTAEVAAKLRELGLPLPGVLGILQVVVTWASQVIRRRFLM
jgi:epsilon-lactone hydrolase